MSKKVLIISASPRKHGNSDLLCDQFMAGAKDVGNSVEKIRVQEKNINFCLGCMACQNNGGKCIQNDDMAGILEKMTAADVLVMATPVYFYTMNAQMKILIDRTHPKYPDFGTKDIYFIVSAADTSKEALERTIEGFRGFTYCYSGLNEKGTVYGIGAANIGDIKGTPAMEQAYEMGKNV